MARQLGWLLAVVLVGCGSTHSGDDAGSEDAGPPPMMDGGSDAGAVDAGPTLEECTVPGSIEMASCGMCGTTERFCNSDGYWEYGECTGEPADAVCVPGTRGTTSCGACGTSDARCTADCHWDADGTCTGETGACVPGMTERTFDGCPAGETQSRVCDDVCAWETIGSCGSMPTDFDGDGSPYGTDCDDTDPAVMPGVDVPCGRFACGFSGGRIDYQTSTRRCVGPGWTTCDRPTGCTEPTGTEICGGTRFASEVRPCGGHTEVCDPTTQRRSCSATMDWTAWTPTCPDPPTIPAECAAPTSSACGACGEGIRYSVCTPTCTPFSTECMGLGCSPGATVRDTSGCPAGQFRESTCSDSCIPGAAGACTALPPDVDIMILVDMTGSHAGQVRANANVLANQLSDPLLGDADVRVGVAYFADFPVTPHGGAMDTPFGGELLLTNDMAAVRTTLTGLPSFGGGDLPESAVPALDILAGSTPHPLATPLFTCPSGTDAGGCWRTGSQRIVVLLTDAAQHDAPHPAAMTALAHPYSGITPVPRAWPDVRTALRAASIYLFAIVPEDRSGGANEPEPQIRQLVNELGVDPATGVETYVRGGFVDLTPQVTSLSAAIAAFVGITP